MPRSSDEQHEMLQYALDSVREAAQMSGDPMERHEATLAAVRQQEVEALTLIALELRALRIAVEKMTGTPRYAGYGWTTQIRPEGLRDEVRSD